MTLLKYNSEKIELELGISRIEKRLKFKIASIRKIKAIFPGCLWRIWQIEVLNRYCIYLEIENYGINAELSAVKKQLQENKK